jgi:hypothetical protein
MFTDGDDLRQQLVEEPHGQIHPHDGYNLVLGIMERCWSEKHKKKKRTYQSVLKGEMKKKRKRFQYFWTFVLTSPQIWCD